MYLNGLILISSVLDLSLDRLREPAQRPRARAVPADVRRDRALPRQARPDVAEEGDRRRRGVRRRRLPVGALARATGSPRRSAPQRCARSPSLTGLTEDYVDRADLRIEHCRFFGELLRDERARSPAGSTAASPGRPLGDRRGDGRRPVDGRDHRALRGGVQPLRARRARLRERPALRADVDRGVQPWSFKDFEGRPVDVTPELERAMRANPHLQVHVAYGYYDGATPHFAAEDVIAHLQHPRRAAREHRAPLLRGRAHDVRPRAVAAAAEQGPRRLRGARLKRVS